MDLLTAQLLDDFQRDFPLSPTPFSAMAESLETSTPELLSRLKALKASGTISRVGPVFRPNTVGVSTLAAMAVKPSELDTVAAIVSSFPQVNHNYEREHHYNLWFVVMAENQIALNTTLDEIQQATDYSILVLPLLKDYHIDLGFSMQLSDDVSTNNPIEYIEPARPPGMEEVLGATGSRAVRSPESEKSDLIFPHDLVEAIQSGFPLVETPYDAIGKSLGWSGEKVINEIGTMLNSGAIKRMGVIVRHRELGYCANAMVVWDVPNNDIDEIGYRMGDQSCVNLCYQRPRALPNWRYNLFCMVHGKDRDEVLDCVDSVADALGLQLTPREVLFSAKRFKQRGAHYRLRH